MASTTPKPRIIRVSRVDLHVSDSITSSIFIEYLYFMTQKPVRSAFEDRKTTSSGLFRAKIHSALHVFRKNERNIRVQRLSRNEKMYSDETNNGVSIEVGYNRTVSTDLSGYFYMNIR